MHSLVVLLHLGKTCHEELGYQGLSMGLFLAVLQGSIWIPLAALTCVVSILDLGGMILATLTQLALFLARISSQGLTGNRIV